MEEGGLGSIQPWQLFTAMFVGFWATSAYFDHFLLTGVFCIAYGVVAEIMSKHLYGGDEIPTCELDAKKAELARLEREAMIEEMEERELKEEKERILSCNEAIWQKAEEELVEDEDDDDAPPPLPARDYAPPPLVSLLDPGEDLMTRSIYLEEQRMPTLDDVPDVSEEHAVYERSMSDEFNQNTTSLDLNSTTDDGIVEENGLELAARQDNHLHFAHSVTQSAIFQGGETLASQGDLMSEEVARAVVNGVSSSEEEEDRDEAIDGNLVFAPDSSDDDDEEEEVNKEIQFDDSDSDSSEVAGGVGQEEFDFMRKQEEKMVSLEDGLISSPSDNDSKSEGRTNLQRVASLSSSDGEEKPGNVMEGFSKGSSNVFEEIEDTAGIPGSEEVRAIHPTTSNIKESPDNVKELSGSVTEPSGSDLSKMEGLPGNIQDFEGRNQYHNSSSLSSSDSSPVIDIDLTDPEMEAAATKIQTAFKGFKSRKQQP